MEGLGVSVYGRSLSGGLCQGESLSRGNPLYAEERAVRILLECFLLLPCVLAFMEVTDISKALRRSSSCVFSASKLETRSSNRLTSSCNANTKS